LRKSQTDGAKSAQGNFFGVKKKTISHRKGDLLKDKGKTGGKTMKELMIGKFAASLILTVFLGIIYKMVESIPDKWKSLIAVLMGIGLGMAAMEYAGKPWIFVNIVDYGLKGLLVGAGAIGLYEIGRIAYKPRQ